MEPMNTGIANIKRMNETDERCKSCFLNSYKRLFEKFNVGINHRQQFMSFYQEVINKKKHLSSPEIQRELNNGFCKIINVSDLYKEEKRKSNSIALDIYSKWKPIIFSSANPFDLALRLSIAGNIIDYGANNNFNIEETIQAVLSASFAIDHSELLQNKIKRAERILYLGDNAGEIVFDKLLIKTMLPRKVFYAVKGAPVLNDVTTTDAKEVGMELVAEIISNGYDAPSTVLNKCSKNFLEVYNSADLIISKGQGNYEGLMNENDDRIFFLLMVKCDFIAEKLNLEKNSFVVYNKNL
jgi:uncharacterized protein with ATP-grasp and redox domains